MTIYSSVLVFTDSSLAFLNKLRRRLLNITFSLRPGHGAVFAHLEAAMVFRGPHPLILCDSGLFYNGSRHVKRWWGVAGFQCANSGNTLAKYHSLRTEPYFLFFCSCPPASETYRSHGRD